MLARRFFVVLRALSTFLMVGPASALAGDAPCRPCSPAVTNSACTITIDGDNPSSPLQTKVARQQSVTLVVLKRPLDIVQFDVSSSDVPRLDPAMAILNAVLPSLLKVKIETSVSPPERLLMASDGSRIETLERIRTNLDAVDKRQAQIELGFGALKRTLDAAARDLMDFQQRPHAFWNSPGNNLGNYRISLIGKLEDAWRQPPPAGTVAGTRQALTTLRKDYENFRITSQLKDVVGLEVLETQLNDVEVNQSRLEQSVLMLAGQQDDLGRAAGVLKALDDSHALATSRMLGNPAGHDGVGGSTTVKISLQNALTKAVTQVATVVVVWNDTRWEVSAGALFSSLADRSFAAGPVVVDGLPQRDAAGKIETEVVETVNRPTVVPMALVHYRLAESALRGRRLAWLATAGIGINASSGSAEYAVGSSVSYRSMVFSILAHRGRDLRLTNGLETGDSLGGTPPNPLPTERYWVWKPSFGLSVRIPF